MSLESVLLSREGIKFVVHHLGVLKTIYDAVSGLMLLPPAPKYREMFAPLARDVTTGTTINKVSLCMARVSYGHVCDAQNHRINMVKLKVLR